MIEEGKGKTPKSPEIKRNRAKFSGCSLSFLGLRGNKDPYVMRAMNRAKNKVRYKLSELSGGMPD